ncbi:zinc transporter 8-like [Xyrichtys novacula]|uniref:Proton-coupled zinc antiporter SLC30A8 n=1 Tax=Xyrichtys novacula TaxID=13765 RepID=A0AAV1HAX8_XYRNO|nr:zinc transporter 8-like [Xyrichtys novacula]
MSNNEDTEGVIPVLDTKKANNNVERDCSTKTSQKVAGIQHCHDNNHTLQDRNKEKKVVRQRLYLVSAVCLIFVIGEILGGYFAGSLAVMTDAAHLLVDLISFIISLISLWLSTRPATHKLSFGWHRAEILGALLSVITIWLVTGLLVYLAVLRLINDDYTVDGTIMLITSGCAVIANIIMAIILHYSGDGHSHGGLHLHSHQHGHKEGNGHMKTSTNPDLNEEQQHMEQNSVGQGQRTKQANASMHAAFVHPEYKIADPICTFLFAIFILCTTVTIMRDILLVLMEGTSAGVKYGEVRDHVLSVKGVTSIHNLHIWALTTNQAVLSAHVAIDESVDSQAVLREITQACFSSYNFHCVTIQMERESDQKAGCKLCEDPQM